ncbi:MAG: molybdenum cofactor biosynthesis protein MoaE [Verrucomicrobiota bacterium]|nr:molybdenum cofactor biosynthesis protein MoaE [Verrucomicrobiota bacterium]
METTVVVTICDGVLPALPLIQRHDCGALVDFFGVVRGDESGVEITGLHYEAYRPMAEREIERISRVLLAEFPCREIHVAHRIGFVPVGAASIAVRIASAHRGEAIKFLEHFMNRLKEDVPIWKRTSPSVELKS